VNGIIIGAVVGSPAFQPPGAVHPFHSPNARTLITERPALWRGPTVARLDYLCRLPVGWNGYRAGPVSFNVAHFALRLLDAVCGPETPAPSLVPGSSGDLQIEWHSQTIDIELHIIAPNVVQAWRETPETGEDGQEVPLTIDFTEVAQWIKTLAEPSSAPIETAA